MILKKILVGIDGLKAMGNLDIEINNISQDSTKIGPNDLFVAIKGFKTDGHKYIPQAISQGAKAVLINEDVANHPRLLTGCVDGANKVINIIAL